MSPNPGCRERTAFDHVIADEYQDLNKADQALIDLLSCAHCAARSSKANTE
jgi:DNA helicase-2/ATP-dependent DNA helicase PcrA